MDKFDKAIAAMGTFQRNFAIFSKPTAELAIAALKQQQEREQGCKPLTLEQLKQMDGLPVWVDDVNNPEFSGWHLANTSNEDSFLIDRRGWKIPLHCLGKERLAYRTKPEVDAE